MLTCLIRGEDYYIILLILLIKASSGGSIFIQEENNAEVQYEFKNLKFKNNIADIGSSIRIIGIQ